MRRPDTSAVVCIVDTGLDPSRLPRDAVLGRCNFVAPEPASQWHAGGNLHATAMARTILKIAPRTRFVSARILNQAGELDDLAVVGKAFQWVAEQREHYGITLICCAIADMTHNISDLPYHGTVLQRVLAELQAADVITVMPAGNFRMTRSGYGMPWPAILREVVSVGALATISTPRHPSRRLNPEPGEIDTLSQATGDKPEGGNGAVGLALAHTSQRLPKSEDGPCQTTLFAFPQEPGETSGACAVVTGVLAALALRMPDASGSARLQHLLAHCVPVMDDEGRTWSAMPAVP